MGSRKMEGGLFYKCLHIGTVAIPRTEEYGSHTCEIVAFERHLYAYKYMCTTIVQEAEYDLFDEISSVREEKLKFASVHLISGVHFTVCT